MTSSHVYRLTYMASPGRVVVWERTAAELLVSNGTESLLDYMLREADARADTEVFSLELITDRSGSDG